MTTEGDRILIIDDDAHFADAVASFLTARQFTVFRAETGQEAVRLAKVERPKLILMDILMSERTEGYSTIREIRNIEGLKDVPIFILSSICANLPDLDAPHGGWHAHDLFIQKPINPAQLLQQIRQHVGKTQEAQTVAGKAAG